MKISVEFLPMNNEQYKVMCIDGIFSFFIHFGSNCTLSTSKDGVLSVFDYEFAAKMLKDIEAINPISRDSFSELFYSVF